METETEIQQRVSAFFTGDLTQDERQRLLAELPGNEALRAEFEFQEAVLFQMQREAMQRYQEKGAFDLPRQPRRLLYAAAAAIAMLVAVGWLFTRRPDAPSLDLMAFADPTGHIPGQTKLQQQPYADSLTHWLKTKQYLPLRQNLSDLPAQIPAGSISAALSDSLYALAVALLHGTDPSPGQASILLEAVAERSEDAFLRGWARRQLVYAADRQGNRELTIERIRTLASEAEDPALRRDATLLLEAY